MYGEDGLNDMLTKLVVTLSKAERESERERLVTRLHDTLNLNKPRKVTTYH